MAAFEQIDLMTKEELAAELINRTKRPAIVAWEEDDGAYFRCMQSFFPEDDPRSKDNRAIPFLLRKLADAFEGSEYRLAERRKI